MYGLVHVNFLIMTSRASSAGILREVEVPPGTTETWPDIRTPL